MTITSLASAYLRAIDLSEDVLKSGRTLDVVKQIYKAHCTTHPFSSVAVKNGVRLSLDAEVVYSTYCEAKQGGVCFESSALVAEALKGMGYKAYRGAGEVCWMGQWTFPLSHNFTVVELDEGTYMLDVGFPLKPYGVVKVEEGLTQRMDDGAEYVFTREDFGDGMKWVINSRAPDGKISPMHRFTLRHYDDLELKDAVDWLYAPDSPFMSGWMLQIHKPDGSNLTIAHGSWAGHDVPADKVKYVVRPPAGGGEAQVTLLDHGHDDVAKIIKEEFKASMDHP